MRYIKIFLKFLKVNKIRLLIIYIQTAIIFVVACNFPTHIMYQEYRATFLLYLCLLTVIPIGAWIDYKFNKEDKK